MTSDDNEPLTRELLDRLRTYVEAKRGRGREIAAQLGIEPSSVSDWLNGRTVPSLEKGLRIQQILARRGMRRITKRRQRMKLDEWLARLVAVPPGQSPLAYGLAIGMRVALLILVPLGIIAAIAIALLHR